MGYRLPLFLIEFLKDFHFRNLPKPVNFCREGKRECHYNAVLDSGTF
jgi:hypothetical protein